MSIDLLSLILDFAVLSALIGTIYYALRLSKSLNNFRAHRNEMKSLIAELAKNINEAQTAIEGLKATSNIAADNLDDVLHDSRRMAEELKMINETSDSLAGRLEDLALRSSKIIRQTSPSPTYFEPDEEPEEYFEDPEPANSDDGPVEPPSFFIQDREFDESDQEESGIMSEAEKELYDALQSQRKTGKGRA